MNIYRLSFLIILIITLLSLIHIIGRHPFMTYREDHENSNTYFRATSDQLLNLHQIPELEDPKKRMETMKAFDYQISKKERITYYKLLTLFDKIMKENGIPYFIHGGTLLGSYRNHDILPWDDDIDVFVNLALRQQLEDLYKNLNMTNVVLYYTSKHDKLYFDNESFPSSKYNWKWPYVDISFYDSNTTHIFDITSTYGRVETFPKSIIFPLSIRPLFTLDLPSPKDTFAYCVWNFGYSDECVMNSYSHIIEGGFSGSGRTKCKEFINRFPYIRRYNNSDGVIEELIHNGTLIQRIKVNEPLYAISESFSIELKSDYSYPNDVDLPVNDKKKVF